MAMPVVTGWIQKDTLSRTRQVWLSGRNHQLQRPANPELENRADLEPQMAQNVSQEIKAGKNITYIGIGVNCLLIILKMITGIAGHSQALIADAVHSISDLVTDAIVLFGIHVGRRPPDKDHHFGHGRLETLASSLVGILLIATAVYLGYEAVRDAYNHVEYHPTRLALAGAGLSIIFKELLYQYTARIGRKIKSQLIMANAWHHRSDALSSVAVFAGVTGAILNPSWHILDAYATLLVSFLILKVGMDIVWKSLAEISDAAPPVEVTSKIMECSLDVEGVMGTHDIRVRSLGGLYQVEIHIVVNGDLTVYQGHRIGKEVEKCLMGEMSDIDKIIVHVDPSDPAVPDNAAPE